MEETNTQLNEHFQFFQTLLHMNNELSRKYDEFTMKLIHDQYKNYWSVELYFRNGNRVFQDITLFYENEFSADDMLEDLQKITNKAELLFEN
jgi:hypothetical protein